MLRMKSFHSHLVGLDAADVKRVVASATQQANEAFEIWKKSGMTVAVLSTNTQLVMQGYEAAYVITLLVDLHPGGEDQDEEVTELDLEQPE
ncbi:MAG TPA: hypothetical protein VNG51_07105 [Ktedonobacteraceae bacterium]|nr:hypothetical protein [Ktedonobacteraceae bacterium]